MARDKKTKAFDCLKMKDDAQARLREKWAGLTAGQVREKVSEALATSDDAVVRW
jgi:hypothetical protein